MPSRTLSAVLLAHEAPDFPNIQDAWLGRDEQHSSSHKFVILGRFDQLILTLADDPVNLFPASGRAITNARAAASSSYVGRVIAPAEFDPRSWAQSHPVAGLCSVRFARRILAAAGGFEFIDQFLSTRLAPDTVRHAVVSATGWEDALVIFFAKDFNEVSRAAGVLRSMRLHDLPFASQINAMDGLTHPCLTTCTLPAFCCQWSRNWTPADTDELLGRLAAKAALNWAVRLELHPGHWNGLASRLCRLSEAHGIPVTCRPHFGQTDLSISPRDGTAATHAGLLRFLLHVIFPLGAEQGTVIRSAETHLHPDLDPDSYQEDPAASHKVDQTVRRDSPHEAAFPEDIREKLRGVAIPPHTLRVLEETLSRVQGMSRDPMHGEEFETLQRLRTAFIRAARRLPGTISEADSRQLQRDVSEWQMLLDRCLSDRFRGPYPVGDSVMMRLGTYQGAHHRFLVVADTLAQQAYDLARGCIRNHLRDCDLPEVALATFIGNSPSAYATAHTIDHLGCGFTDVPATLVCRLRDCHLLVHEAGHHIVRAFFASQSGLGFNPYMHDPMLGLGDHVRLSLIKAGLNSQDVVMLNDYWKKPGVLREIRELLADYFASALCYPGRLYAHKEASLRTLDSFFQGGSQAYLRSVQTEFRLRSGAIDALRQNRADVMPAYGEFVQRGLRTIKQRGGTAIDFDRAQERADVIGYAVHALQMLCALPAIRALLAGFDDCAQHTVFYGEDVSHSLLQDLRRFLSRTDAVSLEENFEFLDRLWINLLRKRERRHLIPRSPD